MKITSQFNTTQQELLKVLETLQSSLPDETTLNPVEEHTKLAVKHINKALGHLQICEDYFTLSDKIKNGLL